jgi:hypothetical protein
MAVIPNHRGIRCIVSPLGYCLLSERHARPLLIEAKSLENPGPDSQGHDCPRHPGFAGGRIFHAAQALCHATIAESRSSRETLAMTEISSLMA